MSYLNRLTSAVAVRGRLCVGIDPMPQVLAAWGLEDDVAGVERCAREIVASLADQIAVFKPQAAFFERFGSAGIAVLERVLGDIREANAISICDVKRGDIGSSMAGYATAFLSPESSLAADAITVSPYLGFGSLQPAIEQAAKTERGVYVLARTSNPEGERIQQSQLVDVSVAQHVIDEAKAWNQRVAGCVGLVIGGTHRELGCDPADFNGSILVPGIGAQGGSIEGLKDSFGRATSLLLPSASREVIGAGPKELRQRSAALLSQLRQLD